jgi:hypothetical protein
VGTSPFDVTQYSPAPVAHNGAERVTSSRSCLMVAS